MADARWATIGLDTMAAWALPAVLAWVALDADACELGLLGCDDARIAELNMAFRNKPQPTNVLSWPAEALSAEKDGGVPRPPTPDFTGNIALGDIAISYDTCQREVLESGKSLAAHATHLLVHGTLHLLGFDHQRDRDAMLMEELEIKILGTLGVNDPYKDA